MSKFSLSRVKPAVPYILSVLRLLLLPALGVFLLQCLSSYQQNFDNSVFLAKDWYSALGNRFWWNYLILLILYGLLYVLPYFKITSIVLSSIVFLFGLGEHFVILFRNTIIFPWDFANLGIASKVASTYNFDFTLEILWAILMFIAMVGLAFVGKDFRIKFWIRIPAALLILLCGYAYMTGFVMNKPAQVSKNVRFYYTIVNYNYDNGVLLNFFYHFQFLFRTPPEGYSMEKAEELLASYHEKTPSLVPDEAAPDVIVIMSEAFADLQNISNFSSSEPLMPYWDSLEGENIIKKTLLVSEYGGNTANSEFEFLTGKSMQFFESGTYPFKQYLRKPTTSLASILKDKGYKTLATHPFDTTGWNRNKVFPLLGFDSFTGEEEYSQAEEFRGYVSDEAAYDYIINQYEESKASAPDTPLLQYLITIQNHGGYASSAKLPYKITPEADKNYPQANQYLSLLRLSDDALKKLVAYFSQVERPTVIVFYGDHLPALNDGFMEYLQRDLDKKNPENMLKRYQTPLLVWANYDISQSQLADLDSSDLGLSLTGAYLADIIGYQQTPFQQFQSSAKSPVMALSSRYIISKEGEVYLAQDESMPEEIKTWLEQYAQLQYYELYDKK